MKVTDNFLFMSYPSLASEQPTTSPLHHLCWLFHSEEFSCWNIETIQIYTNHLSYGFRVSSQALLFQNPKVFTFPHLQGSQALTIALLCCPCGFRYHCIIWLDMIPHEVQINFFYKLPKFRTVNELWPSCVLFPSLMHLFSMDWLDYWKTAYDLQSSGFLFLSHLRIQYRYSS